ncbi:MAG: (deoxy)nucleoside triphosphate pyrophosphohydrolase [Novosphingobium sp.]|nr:(deoxy)nucleoside triphosphate pyrophosphohydrolase [Novosphingobium sp.]
MQKNPTVIPVVAVALLAGDGRVLMQRRPQGGAHGGLWEFPGGKLEPGETLESALIREIGEELGIVLDGATLAPLAFASDPVQPPAPRETYVILLYTCRQWSGAPRCLEGTERGAEIAWFAPAELDGLAMPPLDRPLAAALQRAI